MTRLASPNIPPDGNYRLDATNLTRIVSIGGLTQKLSGGSTQRIILDDVTLSIHPREFVALVGGSGAGKSTLMKAMSGFTPANSGQVLVNGDDLYANFGAYRSILGYVPQDDIIHGQLTVYSALNYAAQLRLPDAPPAEIETRIQRVIQEVELVGHEEKQVQSLSGGQRKRVSIAVELLAEPGLFFLDEPTSGLDPGLEKKMMYTMRQLADNGRTIILVTHATANIDQCTQVAFMSEGGKLAYFGPPKDALVFFQATDFL
ncbi:MAG: ABC transporter ATP-binding protein [Chloroflexi bacterium]|nr:ABC transporter ATP-binding protein [Chloroflexota bacterium]